jgi:hypothetical protein
MNPDKAQLAQLEQDQDSYTQGGFYESSWISLAK